MSESQELLFKFPINILKGLKENLNIMRKLTGIKTDKWKI